MIQKIISQINDAYPLRELDCGKYSGLRARGMHFTTRCYAAQGLGHVSVMQASGFFGLMKMDTVIVNPSVVDMPLLSYDRVFAMGNDTLIFEVYDTVLGQTQLPATEQAKAEGGSGKAHDVGTHWYDSIKLPVSLAKKGRKADTAAFDALTDAYFQGFLADCAIANSCEAAAKREKASVYVEGLLSHGGPSTDVFKKAIGEEQTGELFRRVLFGIQPKNL